FGKAVFKFVGHRLRLCSDALPQFFEKTHRAISSNSYEALSSASSSSRRTETSFETPPSSIVTPYNTSASSIVPLRCVTTMNCVVSANSRKYSAKRETFASSSAASTSSSTQNGTGLTRKMENNNAIAVNARSPPESSCKFCSFLPGGCATI